MSSIKDRVARSLDALEAGRPLVRLVDEIIREYPDPYVLATQHAQRIVRKHTGKAIDPRFIWWHQFETASTSHRSFTGWQHSGPPQKSLHLVELVIKRFDARFQEAPDELDLYGGFYRQGRQAKHFDERNEVAMLGSKVQEDLWALDFAVAYRADIVRFWNAYSQHFRVLAKINMLGQGAMAARSARISRSDWEQLRAMVADGLVDGVLPTLAKLKQDSTASPLPVSRYVLDQGDRGCLYSFAMAGGRILLYRPWASEAFKSFASERVMAGWLREQLQDADTLNSYVKAAHTDARDPSRAHSVRTHLKSLADSASEEAALVLLDYLKRSITVDIFTHLASQATTEMNDNATAMLGNAELRKAMWSGYLSAFIKVFGGFAPIGWPMTLMLLGASLGKVGLDIEAAMHAADEQSRKSALREAMLDSLFAALNMTDLGFESSFASLAYKAPPDEVGANLSQWEVSTSTTLAVEGGESNQLITGDLGRSGRLRGIRVGSDGSCWIVLDGLSYRVRYNHDLQVWQVVPAHNPFAFGPLYPVRLSESNEWKLLVPPRLVGGAPPVVEHMPSTMSRFWNRHLTVDSARSGASAANALRRQKALLESRSIPQLARDQVPDLDERGLDCVQVDGVAQYSYRYDRQYFNSLIEYYTSDESKVNDVFRSGTYRYDDEDEYIVDLVDTLDQLPKSNEVNLYRAGNGTRGTSGQHFRTGRLKLGDVLVNTDLTSFTENPYKVAEFASAPSLNAPGNLPGVFDDTSVVFELPMSHYQDGTPISAFSLYWDEGETLFQPGHYFRIDNLEQVYGEHYRFIHVTLRQVPKPASGPVYDLRTGLLFDSEVFKARLHTPELAERFFPAVEPQAAPVDSAVVRPA
ncbi:dermonecrotic toxin domain-containing protein [Pseudomonas entomophila]|uniref:Dermonecrotic toxin N-terminal domain-containing protein n=2 Tax=Pseudomonas entomophila TaxID=312306 RepID=Q1IDK6_PSEE4|nr:DUF6543 domain-containing protein [Pseudomonas entomophila]WMW04929.1 hypothetical protein RAH46_21790 [Pseudomonas entomophila]CAK14253.1 hypothetical protein PSEEN1376 [Pseudomonas entomophila L48]